MSKVNIVFWSGTGNTAAMAEFIAQGVAEAGGEAALIPVNEANAEELIAEKAFALGCPSMGSEQLEEMEMEPFMSELEGKVAGKQIVLFGSYGWGNQEWMRDWEERLTLAGATVVNGEGITVNGTPGADTQASCMDAGRTLAGLAG